MICPARTLAVLWLLSAHCAVAQTSPFDEDTVDLLHLERRTEGEAANGTDASNVFANAATGEEVELAARPRPGPKPSPNYPSNPIPSPPSTPNWPFPSPTFPSPSPPSPIGTPTPEPRYPKFPDLPPAVVRLSNVPPTAKPEAPA
eukprot:CAMPEP_0183299348 /NCGR_PEP_ID=MMETSP0160_2-20130417/6104_1 /TAXON_ID=2839 ORGANISM="Odontella Sinensis, Strain Grunow 1884" /NCGR_SAMPLE_ID=MMETSP0160_2 /ASSEMBLY_ACC=CAM_ASM_000250 /LENGTH=144 /DNA_ID=CAMNT_0025461571 /DNA_START=52 /DNA_END=487 /DNA_ORIENTATION=-